MQGIPIHPKDCKDDELFSGRKMNSQKQSLPSFASIVSVLSILFYCAGFLRIEFELSDYKKRINAIESVVEVQPPTSRSNFIQTTKNVPGRSSRITSIDKYFIYIFGGIVYILLAEVSTWKVV